MAGPGDSSNPHARLAQLQREADSLRARAQQLPVRFAVSAAAPGKKPPPVRQLYDSLVRMQPIRGAEPYR